MPRASYERNHAIGENEEISKIVNKKNRGQGLGIRDKRPEVEPQSFITHFSFYISGVRLKYEN
jgi:hypothetical protein